jgi:O-antigen chain-terminating methyltransferase
MIAEARKRVELFPPPEKKVPRDHPLAHFREKGGVLDLGCGRGEWLELLKENSVPALGVDQNRFFLDLCRQRGCAVDDANLLDFLRSAPDESVAAITSFHVIEHLPIPVFQEMVNHVFRILCRGGMAIFETPSPTNVLTAGLNFLLDPTHLRPVHPQFATLVLETSGFTSVRLEFMSPYDPSHQVGTPGDPLAQRFNEYFYGPQDYAAIGVKP